LPSQSVIDAVKLALEDENAHQYQITVRKSNFYLNNYEVTLNPNTEILPLDVLRHYAYFIGFFK
jgi:hypothetical protein